VSATAAECHRAPPSAIEAGIDLLCFGNNQSFDPNIVQKAGDIIIELVRAGRISESRIDESYRRITALKQRGA